MRQEIYDYLLAAYGTQLAVTTVKGYADWARPELTPPVVALEYIGSEPTVGRIGGQIAMQGISYQGWLFARNEPELCRLTDLLYTWHATDGGAFEVAGRRVACKLQKDERFVSEAGVQKEAHAITFLVQVAV